MPGMSGNSLPRAIEAATAAAGVSVSSYGTKRLWWIPPAPRRASWTPSRRASAAPHAGNSSPPTRSRYTVDRSSNL